MTHHFFDDLLVNHQYQARIARVTKDARLNKDGELDLETGRKGPWGPSSYPYKTKNERPPISSELRRQMWSSFYVDRANAAEGSLVENPCLGCLAQKLSPPRMLSPLLSNVVAAHIIADAKGGPHGEHAREAWNFMPLCGPCNTNMETQNAVDWFYERCKDSGDYMPLFEMLFRLWRGRHLNHEGAPPLPQKLCPPELGGTGEASVSSPALLTMHPAFWLLTCAPLIQVVDFAKEFYQQGPSEFKLVGGRVEIEGKLYTHSEKHGLQGGFSIKPNKLTEAFTRKLRQSAGQIFDRIESLDNNSAQMRALSFQMAAKIRAATGAEAGWMDSANLLSKSTELLEKWKKDVENLSSTK